jgi:hypothetical protein
VYILHISTYYFKYIQDLLYCMKITTKNTLLIAILTTLITLTPSIISSNTYTVDGTTETPTNSPPPAISATTDTSGIPRVTGESIKKPTALDPEFIERPSSFVDSNHVGDSILPNYPGVPAESDTTTTTSNSEDSDEQDVSITSPEDGATVDAGTLTIFGTSTDTPNTDCQVYANLNEQPYQLATPQSQGDYSTWTFTYTSAYNLITPGDTNELAVELSCGSNEDSDDSDTASDSIDVIGQ